MNSRAVLNRKRAVGGSSLGDARSGPATDVLFTLLWEAIADVLGTATTATLLRRAARRVARRCPELAEIVIAREKLAYRYRLPPTWKTEDGGTLLALRELVGDLRPLLVELTGPVVVRRLERIPEFREQGIISPGEEES